MQTPLPFFPPPMISTQDTSVQAHVVNTSPAVQPFIVNNNPTVQLDEKAWYPYSGATNHFAQGPPAGNTTQP